MSPAKTRTPRDAARIVVRDALGAVFLLWYDNEEVGPHWATPGGGLDAGESPREGARRELREETGWADLEPGPALCTWTHDFTRAGVPVRQFEHIYLADAPDVRREIGPGLAEEHRADGILGWRWWAPEELRHTDEQIWPPQLHALLDGWTPGDPPVELGYVPVHGLSDTVG
ncbi:MULTISPECIES: NUDIX domain-containing protein [Streptomyces]|uniref:NUDIX hydrolase n=1 Tax=Streptomyces TaxID=1883 RepID=UPI001D4959EA|nr:NUDIX domain-containing protein [Streptomyces sp. MAG02]